MVQPCATTNLRYAWQQTASPEGGQSINRISISHLNTFSFVSLDRLFLYKLSENATSAFASNLLVPTPKSVKSVSKQTMGAGGDLVSTNRRAIVQAAEIPLCKCGNTGVPPIIHVTNGIYLNGADGDDHEDFVFHYELGSHLNEFCKTVRKPYDLVVTTILLRASMLFGSAISVASDGRWEQWKGARHLLKELWPNDEITCPSESYEDDELLLK
ncbi:hypothetical protein P3342_012365 [Pyrenophora teres f. teres]|uniref:Uncharacterized protein n=3 Tax=Pyrenophora teres f. teres TaxID=97479 RepID=E3S2I4_PYRTT|nr:hypothetical protein PTT_16522 [Pyrenophora teres f. teres 0-1]KAK1916721.1 hypothetical protein P3342_012365 [Pyrenophora teres f. teres]